MASNKLGLQIFWSLKINGIHHGTSSQYFKKVNAKWMGIESQIWPEGPWVGDPGLHDESFRLPIRTQVLNV